MSISCFKNFYKQLVKEYTPVTGDFDTWGSTLRGGVVARSQTNDVYLFKDIANALGISIQEAVDRVSQKIFEKLFPENNPNPANSEEEYRDAIFNALTDVINEINQEAGVNIKNAKSQKNYTSRIISALGQVTKTFNNIGPQDARAAIQRVNRDVVRDAAPVIEEPVEPPNTEIEKLKTQLIINNYGDNLNISSKITNWLYGVTNIETLTAKQKINFFNIIIKKIQQLGITSTESSEKKIEKILPIVNYYNRVLDKEIINSKTPEGNVSNLKEALRGYEATPRFKFTYQEAIDYKLISLGGRKFIDSLKEKYNATPLNAYKWIVPEDHTHKPNSKITIISGATIKTNRNAIIVYHELQGIDGSGVVTSTISRTIQSTRRSYTIHRFKNLIEHDWRSQRVKEDFYL
jgi:hypothetical protein